MRTLAEEIVANDRLKPIAEQQYADIATVTQDNYFPIVSETYLGQSQNEQFQNGYDTEKDYIWGSIYQDDGNNGKSAAKITNTADGISWKNDGVTYQVHANANSGMPRSWVENGDIALVDGGLYNSYAATAESTTYAGGGTGTLAKDSVCPKGWKLPTSNSSTKDYLNPIKILLNSYGITVGGASSGVTDADLLAAKKYPLSFTASGLYTYGRNRTVTFYRNNTFGFYSTATQSAIGSTLIFRFNLPNSLTNNITLNTGHALAKAEGGSIRCFMD